ncbi:DNA methyltransferase [Brevundimonas nasdae]|uniref:site-specific DNA-methyltransferase (adenine-specific) n=1 Tax=Brevundimonas nasdae TaxID=172043 RepID=A0ABX8TH69_9CAUL|nr:DNA methyltransferase [Brevundimonas nasdae]QYC10581.1 site-specific DNA-methyltransferase [Brevundimonas nasdae]QYC13368.1 site-specific DNA-methyltransferase [Brevundimonas nasdae]
MSRVEVIGGAVMHLGDCLDVLPTLAMADAVVTDPPYGIKADRNRNSERWGWVDYGNGGWDNERPSPEVMALVLKAAKHAVVWGGNYFTDMLPATPLSKWLVWDKGQEGFSLADCEFAWCSFEGAIRRKTCSRSRALQDGKEHPTQKALAVMEWCIGQLPKGCGSIIDPFAGSGTTGIAAVRLGMNFVGVERDPGYFDIACRRLEEAYRQPRLFAEPPARTVQLSMLGDDK